MMRPSTDSLASRTPGCEAKATWGLHAQLDRAFGMACLVKALCSPSA